MDSKYLKYVHGEDGYSKVAWIVGTGYRFSVSDVTEMYEEIHKDFPLANPSSVTISHLGGSRFDRMFSMEYMVPDGTEIPTEYAKRKLETTFHK